MKVPQGLIRCDVCGEYTGTVRAGDLSWEEAALPPAADEMLRVRCICDGIPCKKCHENKIHRPGSNVYDPETNEIWHIPHFAGMQPCPVCRGKAS